MTDTPTPTDVEAALRSVTADSTKDRVRGSYRYCRIHG